MDCNSSVCHAAIERILQSVRGEDDLCPIGSFEVLEALDKAHRNQMKKLVFTELGPLLVDFLPQRQKDIVYKVFREAICMAYEKLVPSMQSGQGNGDFHKIYEISHQQAVNLMRLLLKVKGAESA